MTAFLCTVLLEYSRILWFTQHFAVRSQSEMMYQVLNDTRDGIMSANVVLYYLYNKNDQVRRTRSAILRCRCWDVARVVSDPCEKDVRSSVPAMSAEC